MQHADQRTKHTASLHKPILVTKGSLSSRNTGQIQYSRAADTGNQTHQTAGVGKSSSTVRGSAHSHVPFVHIGSLGRLLQSVHGAGALVGAEHRAVPATGADCLDGALAQLLDPGAVPGHRRRPTGVRPGNNRPWGYAAGAPGAGNARPLRAVTGPPAVAVPGMPGTCRGAAVTIAVGPASAWISVCEAIT